jgi:DNA-binding XRE family transcriptional regulator
VPGRADGVVDGLAIQSDFGHLLAPHPIQFAGLPPGKIGPVEIVGDLFEQRQDADRRRVATDMTDKEMEVFAAQIRAARALLNWSQDDLATRSGVSRTVIARLESGQTDARTSTTVSIRSALKSAGIRLVDDDGDYGALVHKHLGWGT